jgi:hypothetical protein
MYYLLAEVQEPERKRDTTIERETTTEQLILSSQLKVGEGN